MTTHKQSLITKLLLLILIEKNKEVIQNKNVLIK